MRVGEPVWRDLETPRALSVEEHRLVERLAAAVDDPLLDRQVATASVTALCRCGCSSIRLHSDEPPIAPARVAQLSEDGRSDYFCVTATADAAGLPCVQVVLHVVRGRIDELEVFVEEGVAVPLAGLTGLSDTTVS